MLSMALLPVILSSGVCTRGIIKGGEGDLVGSGFKVCLSFKKIFSHIRFTSVDEFTVLYFGKLNRWIYFGLIRGLTCMSSSNYWHSLMQENCLLNVSFHLYRPPPYHRITNSFDFEFIMVKVISLT